MPSFEFEERKYAEQRPENKAEPGLCGVLLKSCGIAHLKNTPYSLNFLMYLRYSLTI